MKKLLITISFLFIVAGTFAQKPFIVFGHVPKNLFTGDTVDRTVRQTGDFLWSLDAVVSGPLTTFENGESQTVFISGFGAAIGYKYYTPDMKSKWGISLGVFTKVQILETIESKLMIAILPSIYNLVIGPAYVWGNKYPGIMIGSTLKF